MILYALLAAVALGLLPWIHAAILWGCVQGAALLAVVTTDMWCTGHKDLACACWLLACAAVALTLSAA